MAALIAACLSVAMWLDRTEYDGNTDRPEEGDSDADEPSHGDGDPGWDGRGDEPRRG